MGLDWLDRSTNQFGHYKNDPKNPFSLSGNEVITLHEDLGGELWIGTFNNGLNRLDRQTGQFKHYQHNPDDPTSLSNNSILSIYQDLAGVLWIGTAGGGLNKFDSQTESFIHYTQKDGLPNDVVYGILEDDQGYLWLSTNHGLSRFDQRAETFNNYDAGDGLQSNEFNMNSYVKTRNGVMFFGGVNGLNTFSPKEISDSSYLPPVVLTSLTQDGKVVNQGQPPEMIDSFTLRWPQNSFDFEFAALSYAQPEENQYAYMLEGFDENWIEMATRRFGRYTSLPGGKYILKIKGASNNGIWNEEGLSIQVNVIPPMWETWWFRGAGALLMVGIIFGASRLRVKRIQAHNRDLEKLIGERTRSLEARTLEAEQNRQELDALYRAEEKMYRHVHLDEVLQALVDVTVGNLQADKSAVLAWDERREQWVIRVARGFSPEAMAIISFARGEGIIGYVTESGEGIILEDVATDPQRQNERPENVQALLDEGIQSLIYLPIKIGDEVFGIFNVSFVRAHAFGQDEQKLFTALVKRAALAIENARLFDAEQRRVEQFRVIAEVSHRFTLTLDINDLLNQVVRLIQQTFNYYHVGIGLIEGQEIVYRVGAGGLWDNMQFKYKPGRLRLGQEGLSGWVGAHGEPLLVQDVSHDPRYVWMEGSQTRSEMVVPITVKEETIGVLDVQSDELNAFDERDLIVIQSLANQVGAAIENARLYIQAKDLAIMEERSRLARDLHDSAKQKAFAALAQLGAAGSHLKNDPSDAKGHLTEAENLVYEVIQELTFLIQEMYPLALKEKGLVTVLREYIFEWENRNNIKVDLKVEGAQQLSLQVEQTLYRISQEALANIARHSQASKVEISVCYKADCVELVVSDNGKGFDVTKKTQNGLGLISMRERVKTIGGSIAIESSPGTGTRVSVSVPFEIDT